MRSSTPITASLGLLLALGAVLVPALAHAQRPARALITTIRLDPAARVLDMSLTGATTPPQWSVPTFDDSSWDHAQPVAARTLARVRTYMGSAWTSQVGYWGPNGHDNYLFRQTFVLPRAHDYYGSELDITAVAYLGVTVNGRSIGYNASSTVPKNAGHYAIAAYLHGGTNVIAIYANAASLGSSQASSALMYTATLRATGVR